MKTSSKTEIEKMISKIDFYTVESFEKDAKRYIKAIKEGRMICSIGSVSKSGMSRTIKFLECRKHKRENRYQYFNFYAFFRAMGYTQSRNSYDYFLISGCGMDMIFHTNYEIIHELKRLGFMNAETCRTLAQQIPPVI